MVERQLSSRLERGASANQCNRSRGSMEEGAPAGFALHRKPDSGIAKALIDSEQIVHAMSTLESVVRQFWLSSRRRPHGPMRSFCGATQRWKAAFPNHHGRPGNWLQSRSAVVSKRNHTSGAPSHLDTRARIRLHSAVDSLPCTSHSSPLGIKVKHRISNGIDVAQNGFQSKCMTVHSPQVKPNWPFRISRVSPDQPTGLPDIRCGSFQLNLE